MSVDIFWVVATAAAVNAACALVGCQLVLRRLSLAGDAVAHAVLPGVALAYLLTEARTGWPVFLGAMAAGVALALVLAILRRAGGVTEDAGLGVAYTAFFALGVLLITRAADTVDLDPNCVLYGDLELVPLGDFVSVGWVSVPIALTQGLAALAGVTLVLATFHKEWVLSAFDPDAATAAGVPAGGVHLGLLSLTAAVSVAAFDAVGSVLVVAMLIVPAAAARLLTRSVGSMYLVAVGLAVLASWLGVEAAARLNAKAAGCIAVAAGLILAVAVVWRGRR